MVNFYNQKWLVPLTTIFSLMACTNAPTNSSAKGSQTEGATDTYPSIFDANGAANFFSNDATANWCVNEDPNAILPTSDTDRETDAENTTADPSQENSNSQPLNLSNSCHPLRDAVGFAKGTKWTPGFTGCHAGEVDCRVLAILSHLTALENQSLEEWAKERGSKMIYQKLVTASASTLGVALPSWQVAGAGVLEINPVAIAVVLAFEKAFKIAETSLNEAYVLNFMSLYQEVRVTTQSPQSAIAQIKDLAINGSRNQIYRAKMYSKFASIVSDGQGHSGDAGIILAETIFLQMNSLYGATGQCNVANTGLKSGWRTQSDTSPIEKECYNP